MGRGGEGVKNKSRGCGGSARIMGEWGNAECENRVTTREAEGRLGRWGWVGTQWPRTLKGVTGTTGEMNFEFANFFNDQGSRFTLM